MRLQILLVSLALAPAASCAGPAAPARGTGQVSFALLEEDCARYCASRLTAEAFRVLPCSDESADAGGGDLCEESFGEVQVKECTDAVIFADLPVGQLVRVRVTVGAVGGASFSGVSGDVAVLADQVSSAEVELVAGEAPAITEVSPDPVAAGAAVRLEVNGEAFGDFDDEVKGDTRVELDGVPLQTELWTAERVEASAEATVQDGEVVVRTCGIASAPFALRVLRSSLDTATLQLPTCAELSLRDAAPRPGRDELLLAVSCGAPATGGALAAIEATGCALSLEAPLPALDAAPTALAVEPDGAGAWLGNATGLVRVTLDTGEDEAGPVVGAGVRALAATAAGVYAVSGGDAPEILWVVDGAATAVDVMDLSPVDVEAASAGVTLLAAGDKGIGWLVAVDAGATVSTLRLDGCTGPRAVAVGAADTAAALCSDGGEEVLVVAAGGSDEPLRAVLGVGGPFAGPVLDARGDVILVAGGASAEVRAFDATAGELQLLSSWPLEGVGSSAPLVAFPTGRRFLLGGQDAGQAHVLAPYQGEAACPAQ